MGGTNARPTGNPFSLTALAEITRDLFSPPGSGEQRRRSCESAAHYGRESDNPSSPAKKGNNEENSQAGGRGNVVSFISRCVLSPREK